MQVIDFERDINLIKSGGAEENLIYQKLVGLKDDLSGPQDKPSILNSSDESDESETESESESSDENKPSKFINSARPKGETTEDKKVKNVCGNQRRASENLFVVVLDNFCSLFHLAEKKKRS